MEVRSCVAGSREVLTKIKPGQKLQRDESLFGQMEKLNCVDNLPWGHKDVDDTEILLEAMADKDDPSLQEEEEFQVGGLEGGEVLGTHAGV